MSESSARRPARTRAGPLLPPATLAGFIVAILAVAFIAFFTWRALQAREVAAGRITQTFDSIQQLEALLSNMLDAETAQRGFLLTGDERYLEPLASAKATLGRLFSALRTSIGDDPSQRQRIDALEQIEKDKIAELDETIALRRAGNSDAALETVRTDRGREAMDRFRATVAQMESEERSALAARQAEWDEAVALSSRMTWGGSVLLLFLIVAAAFAASRDHTGRETEMWVRAGQGQLAEHMQGEQRLDVLGDRVLAFLAAYLRAPVGAIHIRESDGRFRRFAAYAAPASAVDDDTDVIRLGEGLLGQA